METVEILLSKDNARVIFLGPGGIGKTSSALKVMHHPKIVERYDPFSYWIPCAQAASPSKLVELMVQNMKIKPTCKDHLDDVVIHLKKIDRRSIILFDNFETSWDVDDGGKRVKIERILSTVAAVPQVSILVTLRGSQRPGSLTWDNASAPPLGQLDLEASRATFMDHCPTAQPDEHLDELLKQLDYMPLAVVLIARMGALGMTPQELLTSWRNGNDNATMLHESDHRTQSVNVSIQMSLDSPRIASCAGAKPLLGILSLLPAGAQPAMLKGLESYIPDIQKARVALLSTSLAYYGVNKEYIHVLSPIRHYIMTNYPPSPESSQILSASYYALVKSTNPSPGNPDMKEDLAKLRREETNIEAILFRDLQAEGDNLEEALQCAVIFSSYVRWTHPRVGVLEVAIQAARNKSHDRLLAQCTQQLGDILRMKGDPEGACEQLTEALKLFETLEDLGGQAQCHRTLGDIAQSEKNYPLAHTKLETSLHIFEQIKDPLGQALCRRSLGDIFDHQGDYDLAAKELETGLQMFRLIGNYHGQAQCHQRLGKVFYRQNRYGAARSESKMALGVFEDAGDHRGQAQCHQILGDILCTEGNIEAGQTNLKKALEIFEKIEDPVGQAQVHKTLEALLVPK